MSDSNELPTGWTETSISEITTSIGGGTPPTTDPTYWEGGAMPWVSPKDMKAFRIRQTIDSVTDRALERLTVVPPSSVLVVVRSGILARSLPVAINDCSVVLNQDMRAFVPHTEVNVAFIAWQLVALTGEILERCTKDGTTVASIEASRLAGFGLTLAPAPEQDRVVEAIESLLSALDAGTRDLGIAKRKVAVYRQSLLKSAVEGRLTAEWRQGRYLNKDVASQTACTDAPVWLPPGWHWLRVDQLPGINMSNGRSVPTAAEGAKVLRLTAVRAGRIDLGEYKLGAWSDSEAQPFAVREGDLLVVRGNGSLSLVGRAGVVPAFTEQVAYPDTLIRVRCDTQVVRPRWLACVWDSELVRNHLERRARTSAGIYKISQPDIASATLPLPPLDEQDEALALLDAELSRVDSIKQSLALAEQAASAQRQNILRAAFSGQLVPQDPNDEPASVLLERIRAQRSAAGDKPAARRPRKAKIAA